MRFTRIFLALLLFAPLACTTRTQLNDDPLFKPYIGKKIILLKDFYSFDRTSCFSFDTRLESLYLIDSTANIYYAFKSHGAQNIGKYINGEKIVGYFPPGTIFIIIGFQRSRSFGIGNILECFVIEPNNKNNIRYYTSDFNDGLWPPKDYNNLFDKNIVRLSHD